MRDRSDVVVGTALAEINQENITIEQKPLAFNGKTTHQEKQLLQISEKIEAHDWLHHRGLASMQLRSVTRKSRYRWQKLYCGYV